MRNAYILIRNLKGGETVDNLKVHGKIILKWILK
jgi:hypothetical protein